MTDLIRINRSASSLKMIGVFACVIFVILGVTAGAKSQTPVSPAAAAVPDRLSDSFAEIARLVEPAVVSIDIKGRTQASARAEVSPPSNQSDDILEFFRRQLPRRPTYSVGSGFIVDKSGYIMTNAHVVDDAAKITIKLGSGEEFPAAVIGTDEETDLAVLKIDAGRELPFVKLGDSGRARVGEWVLAIGSPFGLSKSVTAGIISQVQRETPGTSPFQKFIQTDAAINRGNSGGPLVNMSGEVIGVNSQIATSTGDYNGVGFALPSSDAESVYRQILKNGKVRRGFLGVALDSVKPEFAKVYGLKDAKGAIITDVREGRGGASAAGLQSGDVIIEYDGKKVENAQDLIAKVSASLPDQAVNIVYLRENESSMDRRTATVTLGERPGNERASGDSSPKTLSNAPGNQPPFGLALSELTAPLATKYRLGRLKGVLVTAVNPESFIADVKQSNGGDALSEGDLIQRINRQTVSDPKIFASIVNKLKKGDAVVMSVMSSNEANRAPTLKIVQFTVQ